MSEGVLPPAARRHVELMPCWQNSRVTSPSRGLKPRGKNQSVDKKQFQVCKEILQNIAACVKFAEKKLERCLVTQQHLGGFEAGGRVGDSFKFKASMGGGGGWGEGLRWTLIVAGWVLGPVGASTIR